MKTTGPENLRDRSIEKSFGQVLRDLRQDRQMSQESLGFKSGYHRTYISLLERGLKSPSLNTIFQLARVLQVEPCELVKHVQEMVKQRVAKGKGTR